MLKFNFKNKKKVNNEFASEIIEILEEKLDEMNIKIPKDILDLEDEQIRFRSDLRKELVYEIADFISINKRAFLSRKAA